MALENTAISHLGMARAQDDIDSFCNNMTLSLECQPPDGRETSLPIPSKSETELSLPPATPTSDPLVVLGFDIVYEILPFLRIGDLLNLQATSKAWHDTLGGCQGLWRRRLAAAVSTKQMAQFDETVRRHISIAEQGGQPLQPFEVSHILRGICRCPHFRWLLILSGLEEYSPARAWNEGRHSHFTAPAHPSRLIWVERDRHLSFALESRAKEGEALVVRDLSTGRLLSLVDSLPANGSFIAGHGYVVVWWVTKLQRGVCPVAPASYLQVYKVGCHSGFGHKEGTSVEDRTRGKVQLVKSIAANYWLYGATLHVDVECPKPRTTLAVSGIPAKLSNNNRSATDLHETTPGRASDQVPPHWTADRTQNRVVHFYDLEGAESKPYHVLDLGKFIGFYRNITIDEHFTFITSDTALRVNSRSDPSYQIELSLRSKHLLSLSRLTVQLQSYQEIEVRAAANSLIQRVGNGELHAADLDIRQLLSDEVASSRKNSAGPQVRSAWLSPEGFWGSTSSTY